MQTRAEGHLPSLLSLSLVVITLGVFWQVQGNEFLIWDDYAYVVENPHVRSGFSTDNVLWAFTTTQFSYWHPLPWLSHMLDCELYGLNPRGHHFNALLLHVASTLILFHAFRKMSGALWQSAFVAAVFAIHPLRIESVAWVTERKDVLGTLFWMAGLWFYLLYVKRPGKTPYLLLLLSFALVLMSKATLITLPFVLLLLDYWPLGPLRWGRSGLAGDNAFAPRSRSLTYLILEKTPLFLLAAGSGLLTVMITTRSGAVNPDAVPVSYRLANALVSYVKYIGKMIWPADLAFLYPHPMDTLPPWQVVGSLILLTLISLFVFLQAKRHAYLAAGWLWYLGTLLPVIGLVQVGAQGMADRFTYVPQVGVTVVAAWGLSGLTRGWRYRALLLSVSSGLVLCLLAASTFAQLRYWKDNISLFSRAVQVTRGNFLAHNLLGNALAREGRTIEAMSHFSEALRINPVYVPSLYNLGFTLAREGRLQEAAAAYSSGLRLSPKDATLHNNLGNILARMGQREEAVRHFLEALKVDPRYAPAHNNLANVYMEQGRRQEAVQHYKEALGFQPGFEEARHNLERALRKADDEKGKGPDETDSSR